MNNTEFQKILNCFGVFDDVTDFETFKDGHINATYKVTTKNQGCFIVQKVNTSIFDNPKNLMANISSVTSFLKNKLENKNEDTKRRVLNFRMAKTGEYFYIFDTDCFRVYDFIENTYTPKTGSTPDMFCSAGEGFGEFALLLDDFDGSTLFPIIKDFHDTKKRLDTLKKSAEKDKLNRKKDCTELLDYAFKKEKESKIVIDLLNEGKIKTRVTHNDTKINNILFDSDTNKALCVIDLDTIMPGSLLFDFGDAIRFGASTAKEDETDLKKVKINLELFSAFSKGYLKKCSSILSKAELDLLAFSSWLMTFECGIRFLTDYLDGDTYFKISHPTHNLERAKNQITLAKSIEENLSEMEKIIETLVEE